MRGSSRQRLEGDLLGDEGIEARIGEQRAGAMARRRGESQRQAASGEPRPTWEETSFSRRLWKAPPRSTLTGLSPYQLISTMVASKAAQAMAVLRPAAVALAWKTMSASSAASSPGRAKSAPSASTTGSRAGVDIDDRHRGARQPGSQRSHQQPDDPGTDHDNAIARARPASHRALSAVSMLAASVARRAGTPSGTGTSIVPAH